ncbi:hypothetical protein NDU88_002352 [Pleurodeles waltl]|uniref:Uncharacterized protein n=1 Tax=Pleurodeles waltl TaxID=8319 RepID=A0AAV7NDE8_PLEWA|nr:hypothetical protein NDU88_002352 [Pleurodeles waltl]
MQRLSLQILQDPVGRDGLAGALTDYFEINTVKGNGMEGDEGCLAGTLFGPFMRGSWALQAELLQKEGALVEFRCYPDDLDGSWDEIGIQLQVASARYQLESFTLKCYRQFLYVDGDSSRQLLAWVLRWESPCAPILHLWTPQGWDVHILSDVVKTLRNHLEQVCTCPQPPDPERIADFLATLPVPIATYKY